MVEAALTQRHPGRVQKCFQEAVQQAICVVLQKMVHDAWLHASSVDEVCIWQAL
jgi:hypothetical protein